MKKIKNLPLVLFSVLTLCTFIYSVNVYSKVINDIIIPLSVIFISILIYFFGYKDESTYKAKYEKAQTVLIIMLVYLIIYFTSGLVFGYNKSPYDHSLIGIITNTWNYLMVYFLSEYIRSSIIKTNRKDKLVILYTTILFILFQMNSYHIYSIFDSYKNLFDFFIETFIPLAVSNILCNYLTTIGGFTSLITYRLPLLLITIFLPIFPDLGMYVGSLFEIILCFVIYIYVYYLHQRKTDRVSRRHLRKYNPYKSIPFVCFIVLIALFVTGNLFYKPIGVLSNSMVPEFGRGDVVITKDLSKNDINDLKIGDIISYNLDGSIIIHRVYDVKYDVDDKVYFITKGDNNELPDSKIVKPDQIKAKVLVKIPKIGYPAVWLYELFNSGKKVDVGLGK